MGSTADSCGSATSIPPTLSPPNPKPKPASAIPLTSPAVQAPWFMKSGRAPADPMCTPKLPQVDYLISLCLIVVFCLGICFAQLFLIFFFALSSQISCFYVDLFISTFEWL
jgi:hypothetical protein